MTEYYPKFAEMLDRCRANVKTLAYEMGEEPLEFELYDVVGDTIFEYEHGYNILVPLLTENPGLLECTMNRVEIADSDYTLGNGLFLVVRDELVAALWKEIRNGQP